MYINFSSISKNIGNYLKNSNIQKRLLMMGSRYFAANHNEIEEGITQTFIQIKEKLVIRKDNSEITYYSIKNKISNTTINDSIIEQYGVQIKNNYFVFKINQEQLNQMGDIVNDYTYLYKKICENDVQKELQIISDKLYTTDKVFKNLLTEVTDSDNITKLLGDSI